MRMEADELSEEVETLVRLVAYMVYLLGNRVEVEDSALDNVGGNLKMSPLRDGVTLITLEADE